MIVPTNEELMIEYRIILLIKISRANCALLSGLCFKSRISGETPEIPSNPESWMKA